MLMGSLNGFHSDLNIKYFTVVCQQDIFTWLYPKFRSDVVFMQMSIYLIRLCTVEFASVAICPFFFS